MEEGSVLSFVWILALTCVALLVAWILWSSSAKRKFREVPGGHPLIGHLLRVLDTASFADTLDEWCENYGTCEFRALDKRFLLLSDFCDVKKLIKARPQTVHRYRPIKTVVDSLAPGLVSAEPPDWQRERRMFSPAFSHAKLETYIKHMRLVGTRLLDVLENECAGGKEVDALKLLGKSTADVIALVGFGQDLNSLSQSSPMNDCLVATLRTLGDRVLCPLPYWRIPFFGDRIDGFHQHKMVLHDAMRRVIEDVRTGKASTDTVLHKFVEKSQEEQDPISERRLIGNVVSLFLAGTDTTSTTVAWCLRQLALDEALQNDARHEALSFSITDNSKFDEILEHFPLLRSLIQEVLRLFGPVPFFALENSEPVEIAGKVCHPGEYILMWNVRYFNFGEASAEYVGPEPKKFDPRRWLMENDNEVKPLPELVTPFGAGRRKCPGRDFAVLEAIIYLVEVLRRFKIGTSDTEELRNIHDLVMRPEREIRIAFEPRNAKLAS